MDSLAITAVNLSALVAAVFAGITMTKQAVVESNWKTTNKLHTRHIFFYAVKTCVLRAALFKLFMLRHTNTF